MKFRFWSSIVAYLVVHIDYYYLQILCQTTPSHQKSLGFSTESIERSPSGKRICNLFLEQNSFESISWVCSCGEKQKATRSRYNNLENHVTEQHVVLYYQAQQVATSCSAQRSQSSNKFSKNIFGYRIRSKLIASYLL